MIKYYCDRCKKETKKNHRIEISGLLTPTSSLTKLTIYDICQECKERITKFLEGNGVAL